MAGLQDLDGPADNPVGINVTAMVDVIFCLCLFFLCTFRWRALEGKIETWLPHECCFFGDHGGTIANEIVIVLRSSATSREVTRKVRSHEPAGNDQELLATVLRIAADYANAGVTRYPIVIDADASVPWQDVVHVMDLCIQNRLERIELTAPGT